MRGFGFEFDIKTGATRSWYAGKDGVRRWASDSRPVESLPVIAPPVGLPELTPEQMREGDQCADRR